MEKTNIHYVTGDLLKSEAQVLVNTVNCVGIMGKGIALQFKRKYPENYLKYQSACHLRLLKIGGLFVHKEKEKIIVNFPTKDHWKNPSEYEYIVIGLVKLKQYLDTKKFKSIAIPKLGCNNGGLDWNIVKPMIEDTFKDITETEIYIYE